MQANNDNPVLNNPYEEPKYYYDTDMDGNIDYATVINGRRPYGYDVNIVPKKRGDKTLFSQEDFISVDPNAEFINGIRKEVKGLRIVPSWSIVTFSPSLFCSVFLCP